MKKNKKIIFFGILVFLICIYFGGKAFYLYYYDINRLTTDDFGEIIKKIKISDTISIHTKKLSNEEYIIFDDMKIKNNFQDFKLVRNTSKDNFQTYSLSSEGKNFKTAFMMGKVDTLLYRLKNDSVLFESLGRKVSNANIAKFLDVHHITNDIELFQFLNQVKDHPNHIFTSVGKMRERYLLHSIVLVSIPVIESISLIDGDYTGYILNATNLKEVVILKNDKRYVYTFYNLEYFTDEKIKELLNTIEIQ